MTKRNRKLSADALGRIESDCARKVRYDTEQRAKNTAEKAKQKRNVDLRVYPCHWCGGWHLTKRMDD